MTGPGKSSGDQSPQTDPTNEIPKSVPQEVVQAFLEQLAQGKVDPEVVTRLRKCLAENADFSEKAVRTAMFGATALQ
jgi:hypothetical protein